LHIFGRERYARPERRKVPHTELLTETEAAFGKQGGEILSSPEGSDFPSENKEDIQ